MIRANKSHWAKILFHFYIMRLLKKNFHQFHLFGDLPKLNQDVPIILIPNHSTWWDGFFVYLLNEKILKRDLYLMMLDSQLAKYKFFARVGAFGITPGDKKKVIESLNYTSELMRKKNSLICIFPQGELLPWGKRPLNFKSGIESIVRSFEKDIDILTLAIRAEFGGGQKAEVFFEFGKQIRVNSENFTGMQDLEHAEEKILNSLEKRILSQEKGASLFLGSHSINEKIDRIRKKK